MSAMNLDTSFTCSTADDSYASVSGASLSERMQSAWYMIEGDDESGNEWSDRQLPLLALI